MTSLWCLLSFLTCSVLRPISFLMSSIGAWFFEHIHLPQVLSFYRTSLHPWVITSEAWFIGFLIIELVVRWAIAIINKHHKRWFFFSFYSLV